MSADAADRVSILERIDVAAADQAIVSGDAQTEPGARSMRLHNFADVLRAWERAAFDEDRWTALAWIAAADDAARRYHDQTVAPVHRAIIDVCRGFDQADIEVGGADAAPSYATVQRIGEGYERLGVALKENRRALLLRGAYRSAGP